MKSFRLIVLAIFTISLFGCNRLSKEAKEIVGTYYNAEISQTEPVMQLHKDASCVITAIKPGVLTYSVDGKWNVENDSLILELDPSTLTYEGDSTLIGDIPSRVAQHVVGHNDFSLQLENGGVTYLYQRRND